CWSDEAPERPADPRIQRGHRFALVDEADHVFIDDARTPLIIAGPTRPATDEEQTVYLWADHVARHLNPDEHFRIDPQRRAPELTPAGRKAVRWSAPPCGPTAPTMTELLEHVERGLHARQRLKRDQHYLVEGDKVEIVDEGTGRRMPERHWQDGLHQA